MKYSGRIYGVFIVTFTWIILQSPIFTYGFSPKLLIMYLAALPFAWLIGRKYDIVKYYSEKDYLTGVYNRRIGLELFRYLQSLVDRNQEKLGIFMIDINDFKDINDTYGHDAGDLVLKKVTEVLTEITRKSDVVIRWGGDELLMIVIFKDIIDKKVLVDRIKEKLTKLSTEIKINISLSIGIAIYPDEGNNIDELVKLADKRMYQYKNSSRG